MGYAYLVIGIVVVVPCRNVVVASQGPMRVGVGPSVILHIRSSPRFPLGEVSHEVKWIPGGSSSDPFLSLSSLELFHSCSYYIW